MLGTSCTSMPCSCILQFRLGCKRRGAHVALRHWAHSSVVRRVAQLFSTNCCWHNVQVESYCLATRTQSMSLLRCCLPHVCAHGCMLCLDASSAYFPAAQTLLIHLPSSQHCTELCHRHSASAGTSETSTILAAHVFADLASTRNCSTAHFAQSACMSCHTRLDWHQVRRQPPAPQLLRAGLRADVQALQHPGLPVRQAGV